MWNSEFTTKVATLQGDSEEIAPTLNVKFWVLVLSARCAVPRDGDGPHIASEAAAPGNTEHGGGASATPLAASVCAAASPRAAWGGAAASASFVAFTP